MISQSKNRVQQIKSKFENLNSKKVPLLKTAANSNKESNEQIVYSDKENNIKISDYDKLQSNFNDTVSKELATANTSYLHGKCDVKRSLSDTKKSLSRQISDPGKKLHRSHAFRCDRSQVIAKSPKRHGSCNGRSETSDFTLKMGDGKLSKDRLKKLGSFLEDQMRKENFVAPTKISDKVCLINSIPDKDVPKHILEQYAKVNKQKKSDDKQDAMTDSGVSSETENLEDDKSSKFKRLMSQFENNDKAEDIDTTTKDAIVLENAMKESSNLVTMDEICASSETMKLERKNPHLILTDTLKKALKQPLPPGPPPKKPPRTFVLPILENPPKKDPRKMLEKLEQVLQKREAQNSNPASNIYDIAETDLSMKKPKEIHYLCTEIIDITHRTLLPNQGVKDPILKCFNSLNCSTINNSMSSLPYTRLNSDSNRNSVKMCCSCSNDSLDQRKARLSSFLEEKKCSKCHMNEEKHDRFKCHLNCECKMVKSEFFVDNEHIYDEPYLGNETDDVKTIIKERKSMYGSLNATKVTSKSMEDLRRTEEQIYEIPYDVRPQTPEPTYPATPESVPNIPEAAPTTPESLPNTHDSESLPNTPESPPKTTEAMCSEFAKLRQNFENGFQKELEVKKMDKPAIKLKPILVSSEKRFSTEKKRYRNRCEQVTSFSLPKRNTQLDVDRENLNALMNEIYETVTAACNMDEHKPGSFPTDHSDGNTSEDSVKLTRSLTEKRKNYVRRVSSRVAYLEPTSIKTSRFRHQTSICSYKSYKSDQQVNPYSTFRSWKSFRTSQNNLTKDMTRRDSIDSKINLTDSSGNIMSMDCSDDSIDKLAIDEKTGCVDIDLPFEPRERGLFNICLLVGLNYMTGEAYVKSVFPSQVQVPPHIENLVFPETLTAAKEECSEAKGAQCYSLVLTDERGERSYGYCRRVLPEGATSCLPLCYCLIGRYRAPGFYYKVLQEIESHHGSSEVEIHSILQQLFETDFPNPGEEITITHTNPKEGLIHKVYDLDFDKSKTLPDMRNRASDMADYAEINDLKDNLPEFYDLENNNSPKKVLVNFGPRIRTIKRPIEPRVDEDNLSVLLDLLGAGLAVKVFGSLLLERKVIIIGDQLSLVSRCLEALQSALYPFVWQQPLISAIPGALRADVLGAPLPILAGMLAAHCDAASVDDGMLLDLTHPTKVLSYQGDESTILPTSSYKTLKTSLQMESIKNKDRSEDKMRNVMISEAFMRFFVDILGDFWAFFSVGVMKEGDMGKGDVVFDKDSFIKNASSKQNQYFLEWFTETAMFNHFIQNMAACFHTRLTSSSDVDVNLVDTPLPNFYQLFDERVRSRSKAGSAKNVEGKGNYKSAVNKKVRLLKNKLKDLVT